MGTRCCVVLLATLTAAPLAAQRTWVVDAAGGGDFRTVSAAFAAAASGDTVVVRRGNYPEDARTTKGLTVLGEGDPVLDGFGVYNLPASQTFVASGLTVHASRGLGVYVESCLGHVHLDRIVGDLTAQWLASPPALVIRSSALVSVARSRFAGYAGASVATSTVYFTETDLLGSEGHVSHALNRPAQPGLSAGGVVVLAGGTCVGGKGTIQITTPNPPAPGIHVRSNGELFVTGSQHTMIAAGGVQSGNTLSAPAIEVAQWVRAFVAIDPRVQLRATNTTQLVKGVNPLFVTQPALVAAGAAPGNAVRTELFAPPGWVFGLFIGLPGHRRPLVPLGDLWLAPPILLLEVGTVASTGNHVVQVPLPSSVPRGTPVALQSLTLSSGLVFQLSTPVTVVLH
jgi:hypothetical protein